MPNDERDDCPCSMCQEERREQRREIQECIDCIGVRQRWGQSQMMCAQHTRQRAEQRENAERANREANQTRYIGDDESRNRRRKGQIDTIRDVK